MIYVDSTGRFKPLDMPAGCSVYKPATWYLTGANANSPQDIFNCQGRVGIGKYPESPYKLDVCGTMRATEIKVNVVTGCDFVFHKDYKLLSLRALKDFIEKNHHLPGIEPAKTMEAEGVELGSMQTKLLQKVEEFTLYIIEQDKTIANQAKRIEKLEAKMKK